MKILAAEFMTSVAGDVDADRGVRDDTAQVAFVGRSNVGKSSLLNALTRQKLARTSAAAGKTRTANTYRVVAEGGAGGPGRWMTYLVDLPGYGYARGGEESVGELAGVADAFVQQWRRRRETSPDKPGLIFLLVDARHPGLASDMEAYRWLCRTVGPPQIIATKIDKLSRNDRARHLQQIARAFGRAPVAVSAATGEGLDDLWTAIAAVSR